jgi:hypothetical protein
MTSPRRRLIGVAVLAFVTGIGTVLVVINGRHNIHRGAYAALALGIGWGFIGTRAVCLETAPLGSENFVYVEPTFRVSDVSESPGFGILASDM